MEKIIKSSEEWKKELTPEEYHILRKKGTDPEFSGKYYKNDKEGTYFCAACGNQLFATNAQYDAGCGWPSYDRPDTKESISTQTDTSHSMERTEVICNRCGSHLGHVFDDGPPTTGKRYCINSTALHFKEKTRHADGVEDGADGVKSQIRTTG